MVFVYIKLLHVSTELGRYQAFKMYIIILFIFLIYKTQRNVFPPA